MSDIKLFRISGDSISQVEGQSVAVERVERLTAGEGVPRGVGGARAMMSQRNN